MSRYPEQIQFRAEPGTTHALSAAAAAEGKKPGDIVREAVSARLAASPDREKAVA